METKQQKQLLPKNVGFFSENDSTKQSCYKRTLRDEQENRLHQMIQALKSEIAKFYKLIGFHNPKHLAKIKRYFNSPVV